MGPLLPFCRSSLGDNGGYDVNRNAVNFQLRLGEMQISSLFEKPSLFYFDDFEWCWVTMIESAGALTTVCNALESSACIIYKVMRVSDKLRQQ